MRIPSDILRMNTITKQWNFLRDLPHISHPRLRFFVGRENKLPVDQNSLMAMVAPSGLMLTSSITETAGNPWEVTRLIYPQKKYMTL